MTVDVPPGIIIKIGVNCQDYFNLNGVKDLPNLIDSLSNEYPEVIPTKISVDELKEIVEKEQKFFLKIKGKLRREDNSNTIITNPVESKTIDFDNFEITHFESIEEELKNFSRDWYHRKGPDHQKELLTSVLATFKQRVESNYSYDEIREIINSERVKYLDNVESKKKSKKKTTSKKDSTKISSSKSGCTSADQSLNSKSNKKSAINSNFSQKFSHFLGVYKQKGLKLTSKHLQILKKISEKYPISYPIRLVYKQLDIPETSFYRYINDLESFGIIERFNQGTPRHYFINEKFILKFGRTLNLVSRPLPKNGLRRNFSPNADQDPNPASSNGSTFLGVPPNDHFDEKFSSDTPTSTREVSSNAESSPNSGDQDNSDAVLENSSSPIFSNNDNDNNIESDYQGNFQQKYDSESDDIPPSFPNDDIDWSQFDGIIVRSHNFRFKLPLLKPVPIRLWRLIEKTTLFKVVPVNNWFYASGHLSIRGVKAYVRINPNVVLIHLDEIFGTDPEDNALTADKLIFELKTQLEQEFRGLLIGPSLRIFMGENFVNQKGDHHAWMHHILSLIAYQRGLSLKTLNFEIDSSRGEPELEGINPTTSDQDLINELKDFEHRRKSRRYVRHIDTDLQQAMVNQSQITENLKDQSESFVKASEIQKEAIEHQRIMAGGLMTNTQVLQQSMIRYNQVLEHYESLHATNGELTEKINQLEAQINNYVIRTEHPIDQDGINRVIPIGPIGSMDPSFRTEEIEELTRNLSQQRKTLFLYVIDHQGLTRKQLSEQLRQKRGSINGNIRYLIKQGYLYDDNHKIYLAQNWR